MLTAREEQILKIIWNSSQPLTATDVSKTGKLSVNTVQVVIRKLLKSGLIEVANVVYSGTVLCRSYTVTKRGSGLILNNFSKEYAFISTKISPASIFAALIETERNEEDIILELEKLIARKRQSQIKG